MKKNLFPLAVAMLCVAAPASAQDYEMQIHKTDGTVTTIDAADVAKVTFAQKPYTVEAVPTGTDLAQWYEENKALFETYDYIIIPLAANGEYTQSGVIEIPAGKKAAIAGDAEGVAKLQFTADAGFVAGNVFSLSNVDIDAAASANSLVTLSETPDEALLGATGTGDYYNIVGGITLSNVDVKGLKNRVFYDNGVKYAIDKLTIEDCNIQLDIQDGAGVDGGQIIDAYGGGINDLVISNSTMYNIGAGYAKYAVRYNNGYKGARVGYENEYMTIKNSTFHNLLESGGQWGNYNGLQGSKSCYFTLTDVIFVNCGKDIARRFLGGRAGSHYTFNNNTYMSAYDAEPTFEEMPTEGEDGTVTQPSYDKSGTVIGTAPTFANAANGDFTLGSDCEQYAKKTGDPRWLGEEEVTPAE